MSIFKWDEKKAATHFNKMTDKPKEVHPEGNYTGFIKNVVIKNNMKHGETIVLWIKTDKGMAFKDLYITSTDPKARDYATREVSDILYGAYKPEVKLQSYDKVKDLVEALKDLPVNIRVTHREYNGKKYTNIYFNDVPVADKLSELKDTTSTQLDF